MKVKLTVERGDYNTQVTVGNDSFVCECYLGDISTVPVSTNPNVVDTSDANATADKIFEGFDAYVKGEKVSGTYKQNNLNIVDTATGTATPADVVLNKKAFVKGQEITGTLNVPALEKTAYVKGITDSILKYQKDPLWWDLLNIVNDDKTPNYVGILAVLCDDVWLMYALKGADAYRTSDGAFYEATTRNQTINHVWQPNAYKTDSRGYKTKYVILYFKTPALPTIAWWCYPILAVAKNLEIPFKNFLSSVYSLQCYEHINCTYTGTDATNFLGGNSGTQDFLQSVPEDIDYSNVTVFANALNSRRLRYVNLSTLDTKKLPANFTTTFMPGAYSLDTLIGVLDLTNNTNATVCVNWQFIRNIEVRGVQRNTRLFSQSTMPYETMKGILDNVNEPVTISMLSALRILTLEDIAELTQRGVTITN